METILQELLAAMQQDEPIPFDAIPSIDLYMDQVTTYLDSLLSSNLRSQEDKVFTKTMINNYTKDGLLPSPVKKKIHPLSSHAPHYDFQAQANSLDL